MTLMNFELLLTTLYGLSGLAFVAGYLPQILRLIRNPYKPHSISIPSYVIWGGGGLISSLYVLLYVSNQMVLFVTIGCCLGNLAVLGLALYTNHLQARNGLDAENVIELAFERAPTPKPTGRRWRKFRRKQVA